MSGYAATLSGMVLTANPEIPSPGQRVVYKASYLGFEPGKIFFTWVIDGKKVQEGFGINELAIDAPRTGSSVTISVAAEINGSVVAMNEAVLSPGTVVIEWEGDGGVPPFTPLRPLLTGHGSVRAYAVPYITDSRGRVTESNDLYFEWEVDGVVDQKQSGFGKRNYFLKAPFFDRRFTLAVRVESRDGSARAYAREQIVPRNPEVVLYRTSPLTGLEDGTAILGTYDFDTPEVTFAAYPLNVAQYPNSEIVWTLEGASVGAAGGDPRFVTFRKTSDGAGTFTVGLSYSTPGQFLDTLTHSFLLHF